MLFKAVILVACVLTGVAQAAKKYAGDDLDALCNDKKIKLYKRSQLKSLVDKVANDGGTRCDDRVVSAINDLHAIIQENSRKECSMDAYDNYRQYYNSYLDRSNKEKRKTAVKLPKALKKFAIAYGLQLSGFCRTNMVKVLLDDVRKVITQDDFDYVEPLIGPERPITTAIGDNVDKPDEIILVSDFIDVNQKAGLKRERISMTFATTPYVKRVQTLCDRRFKPVYEKLMFPVAKLANLGFNYRHTVLGDEISASSKDAETKGLIGQWSKIIFMCEIFDQLELVEDEQDRVINEGSDATRVRVESGVEPATGQPKGRDLLKETNVNLDDIKWVTFKPNYAVGIPDDVLPLDSKKNAHVSTTIDERTKIHRRFIMGVIRRLLADFLHYRIHKVVGYFGKESIDIIKRIINKSNDQKEDKEEKDIKTDIIKTLDNLVDSELNFDRAVRDGIPDPAEKFFLVFLILACIASIGYGASHGWIG